MSHLPHVNKTFLKNQKHSLSPTHWCLSAGIISEKPKKPFNEKIKNVDFGLKNEPLCPF